MHRRSNEDAGNAFRSTGFVFLFFAVMCPAETL
jgi:hypothetical protein